MERPESSSKARARAWWLEVWWEAGRALKPPYPLVDRKAAPFGIAQISQLARLSLASKQLQPASHSESIVR